jgi:hypothetical protein
MQALDLSFLTDWDFVGSIGDYGKKQACAMSAAVAAVRVARGEDMNGATDELECVDPVIRKLIIARNDAMPKAGRREWALSMIPRFVGTNNGKKKTVKRAEHIARYAIRVLAAEAMDAAKLPNQAAKLRAISDEQSMSDIKVVAREARDAAYAYAAANAAYAAANANAAYARTKIRLKHLDQMIEDCLSI